LQVDGNAIINGMALVKGKLLAGNGIESSLYIPGSSGWKISADGAAEFNSLTVRTSNLEDDSVTKTVKDARFYVQKIGNDPTVLNTITISAGTSNMDITLMWGGRCGYINTSAECQVEVYKNGVQWIDFGIVGFPSMDMPGWVASDILNSGETAEYSAIAHAAPGIQAEKVTLIAIGRMR
jgi:hypothetical protein